MSKELEALEYLKPFRWEDKKAEQAYNKLKQALTPPTSDEVCKALSECEDLDKHSFITYMPEDRTFTLFKQVRTDDCYEIDLVRYEQGTVYIAKHYPPHLITLIGRFYEVQDV